MTLCHNCFRIDLKRAHLHWVVLLACGLALVLSHSAHATVTVSGDVNSVDGVSNLGGAPNGKLYLIAVGIGDYGPRVPRLSFPVADAQELARALTQSTVGLFQSVEVSLLTDSEATRANTANAFSRVAAEASKSDVFFFYFSGHAKLLQAGDSNGRDNLVLIPNGVALDQVATEGISGSLLAAWCRKVGCHAQQIVLDTTASQGGLQAFVDELRESDQAVQQLSGRSISVLGNNGPSIEDARLAHGVMTFALLKGIRGDAQHRRTDLQSTEADPLIMSADLRLYVSASVQQLNSRMAVVSLSQGDDFAIARLPQASAPRGVVMAPPPEPATPSDLGVRYALLIGTSNYGPGYKPLPNAAFDATSLGDELHAKFGYEKVECKNDPTYRDVINTLKKYKGMKYNPNDLLFIFFAGHGCFDPDVPDTFLAFKDSDTYTLPNEGRLLQLSVLRSMIANIPCRHVFVVIDSCYAGAFDLRIAGGSNTPRGDPTILRNEHEYTRAKLQYRTHKFLTSGRLESVLDGTPGEHSPFVRRLLELFRDFGDRGSLLTYNKLIAELIVTKPEPGYGDFGDNDPGSDFVMMPSPTLIARPGGP
jgi:hypothetical protein